MTLLPDSLLNERYRIMSELGHGGMGAVYRGRDENLGVEVAVKENFFISPEAERQFRREASLLASIRHSNLPRVTDHFIIPDQGQYLVMDFIPGVDAKQMLDEAQGPLPEEKVVQWAREILDALHYLHTRPQPIVHRDIKPGNVKITPEGRAVLVDFGLAKVHDLSQATTMGAKALTPGFAPPEQYGLGRTDPRTDIYSLGATLYTLLTNHIPADSIDRAMGQKKLTPLRDLNPAISEATAAAIERAMAVKPEDRYETAAQFSAVFGPAPTAQLPRVRQETRPVGGGETRLASGSHPGTQPPPKVGTQPPPKVGTQPPPRVGTQPPPRVGTQPPPKVGTQPPPPVVKPKGFSLSWLLGMVLVVVLLMVAFGSLGGFLAIQGGLLNKPASTATVMVVVAVEPTPTAAPPTAAASPTAVPPTVAPPTAAASATAAPPTDLPTAAASPTPAATGTPAPTPTPASTPLGGGGGQIAFASDRKGGVPQVFLIDVGGASEADRHLTQVTNHPDGACQPAWSPDGTRLLFISPCDRKRDQYPNSAIYIINADGTNQQPFIADVGGVFEPDWSQTGIVYTFLEPSGRPRIWVADANGQNSHNISAAQSSDSHPTWSGDGERVAFVNTSASGNPNVYWMTKDGKFAPGRSLPSAVTPRTQNVSAPAWSPDSKLVAYVSGLQIWVIPWDKLGLSGQVQRTDAGPNDSPGWSPDSRHLTFESWRENANHDIYIMNVLTGGELVRLTTDPAQDYQPAWRP
jgi:eukaryotic-like serine/threonine-protein kinase